MSLWTCDKCGWTGRTTQVIGHKTWRCPKQGRLMIAIQRQEMAIANEAAREAGKATQAPPRTYWQYLPCLCGCGDSVGQVKGQKKKHYTDTAHYERHRAQMRRAQARAAETDGPENDGVADERRLAEEMAPILSMERRAVTAIAATPMLSGEASYALWGACLGVAL